MFYRFIVALCCLFLANSMFAKEKHNVMLVLDASGSMWGQIQGKNKIQIAREAVRGLLKNWDQNIPLGLTAYGHREKSNCQDIEALVPVKRNNQQEVLKKIEKLNPKGKTPISSSLQKAARSLNYQKEKATILLVSDGLETCQMDPCAVASELKVKGANFTTHVISFDLKKEEAKKLECIAKNTGGKFLNAANAKELTKAFNETVKSVKRVKPEIQGVRLRAKLCESCELITAYQIHWKVFKGKKRVKFEIKPSTTIKLAPGDYEILAQLGTASAKKAVRIEKSQLSSEILNLEAGILRPQVFDTEEGKALTGYSVSSQVLSQSKKVASNILGAKPYVLNAGNYSLQVKHGHAIKKQAFSVKAGEKTDLEMVMNSGYVKPKAFMVKGGKPLTGYSVSNKVFAIDKKGKKTSFASSIKGVNPYTFPAGKYSLVMRHGLAAKEMSFEVLPGKTVEPVFIMDSGFLKPRAFMKEGGKALGGYTVKSQVFTVNKEGKREKIAGSIKGVQTYTLPAGDYLFKMVHGYASKELPFSLKAGEVVSPVAIMNSGIVKPSAILTKGKKKLGRYAASNKLFKFTDKGERGAKVASSIVGSQAYTLPAGRYILEMTHKGVSKSSQFEIKPGEVVNLPFEF